MTKNRWTLAAVAAVLAIALAGCGSSKNDAASGNGAAGGTAESAGGATASPGGPWRGGMEQNGKPADLMGKIKTVGSQTITVYKSSVRPGSFGGGRRNGPRPSGSANASGGSNENSQSGKARSGNGPSGSGSNRQRFNPDSMFTDETQDIRITDQTRIYTIQFSNNQRTEKQLKTSDLKEGDIVMIWLDPSTGAADSIMLQGGFGMGRPRASASAGQ
jgi:hypothetical protein